MDTELPHAQRTQTGQTGRRSPELADLALVLGVAGLLPLLPVVGSVAAVVLGSMALIGRDGGRSARARAGVALGLVGLAAPLVALFVYCVLLGYPFPIHRYHPG